MRLFCSSLLLAVLSFGATSKSPAGCSSRPCVYTITCAAETCTSAESAEVNTALDDAQRGDTIKLQAGRVFSWGSPKTITRRSGTGVLTITTTRDDMLPQSGVAITPAWIEFLPTLQVTGGNVRIFELASSSPPVEGITFRGLAFRNAGTAGPSGMLAIGQSGDAGSDSAMPNEITVQQCVFHNPLLLKQRVYVTVNAQFASIVDSWFSGSVEYSVETQLISIPTGLRTNITNNLLMNAGGENVMFGSLGGAGYDYRKQATGLVEHNRFTNPAGRLYQKIGDTKAHNNWKAGIYVMRGLWIWENARWHVAQNSGTTGGTEPTWASTINSITCDGGGSPPSCSGGIAWKANGTGGGPATKNLFETKNAAEMSIRWNTFSEFQHYQQVQMAVVKLSNCIAGTSSCQCVPRFTGRVNVNGTLVTSADGNRLPNTTCTNSSTPGKLITINGSQYTIADFGGDDDYKLTLASSAGTLTNVAYTYGTSGCVPAFLKHVAIEHNILERGAESFNTTQYTNGQRSNIGGNSFKHNLFREIDCTTWGGCSSSTSNTPSAFNEFNQLPRDTFIENNTWIDNGLTQPKGSFYLIQTKNFYGRSRFRYNILQKSSSAVFVGAEPTSGEGDATLKISFCKDNNQTCTTDHFDKNVMAAANLTRFGTGTNWNQCAADTGGTYPSSHTATCGFDYNHGTTGKLFWDFDRRILIPRSTHPGYRSTSYGDSIGARFVDLPMVRNRDGREGARVAANNSSAVMEFYPHGAVAGRGCTAEISSTRDVDTIIAAHIANPLLSTDSYDGYPSGAQRYIVATGLSGSTTYWYRLHCGGALYTGSFTTGSSSSARTVTRGLYATADGNYRVVYGTSYSRAADTLSGGAAGSWSACTTGQRCTVSASLPAGVSYWRIERSDGTRWPVEVAVN